MTRQDIAHLDVGQGNASLIGFSDGRKLTTTNQRVHYSVYLLKFLEAAFSKKRECDRYCC